jgi:type II secretory pathway pseudopilin PulG
MKENKGITLIALIITIVIMLILLAVSIDLIIDGKIFTSAEKAVNGTNEKVAQQQGRVDELMGILDDVEQKQKEHNFQYTDNTLAELKCDCETCKKINPRGRSYKIGQQIKLTDSDTLLTDTSAATGAEWVVFGREDTNKDGKYETLLITTLAPSTEKLTLGGADGYNTGIEQIEAKVKEIYGNDVRAMTKDDVNRTLGYTPAGGMYRNGNQWQTTGNFTTKLKDLGDVWTSIVNYNTNNEAGVFYTPAHPEGLSDNGAELGESLLNGYWYAVNSSVGDTGEPTVSENISNVAKNLVFGSSSNNYRYWLASRGVFARVYYAGFGLDFVYDGSAGYDFALSYSYRGSSGLEYSARALVSLKSEIPELGEVLVSSEAWS